MHPALPPAAQPDAEHGGVRCSRMQRSAVICLAAVLGTASWVVFLGLCGWAFGFSLGPVALAAISTAIFAFQLLALSLAAGDRSSRHDMDDYREVRAPGGSSEHRPAHAFRCTDGRPRAGGGGSEDAPLPLRS
jgi:hypothetical protein